MIEWEDSCLIARARVLVLHAMLDLGVQPELRQIKRALEPVLGDLVPVPFGNQPGCARRRDASGRFVAGLTAEASRALTSVPVDGPS